jgi:Skp family chaperone for outer membrane proteins
MYLRLLLAVATLATSACNSVSKLAMEKPGSANPGQLKLAVKAASDAQKDAGKEFQDVQNYLQSMTGMQGGTHVTTFGRFQSDYQECEAQVAVVRQQLRQMDASAGSLNATGRRQFSKASRALHASEAMMGSTLSQFRSQVAYLKQNLNSQSITGMRGKAEALQGDVQRLRAQIDRATSQADRFANTL